MRKINIISVIIFAMHILFIYESSAQITIDGELRTKFFYMDGYKTLLPTGASPVYIASQRTRLNFKYDSEKLKTYVSFEDVRIWGEAAYKKDIPNITIYEGWGEILFNKSISLKIGRQMLRYDGDRLFGSGNWNDVGASHDLALLKYSKSGFNAHLGFAYNNDGFRTSIANYPLNYYKALALLWVSKKYDNGLQITAIGIGDAHQKENSVDTAYTRYTYGANLIYKNKDSKLGFFGTIYHQSGEDVTGNSINASFLSASLLYKISPKLSLNGGTDYFSGNDALDISSNTRTSFNNLYGSGHKFYGYMDYFTSVEAHTKGGGLMDIFAKLKYKLGSNTSAEASYHNFSFTNNVIDPESDPLNPTAAEKALGSEIDLLMSHNFSKGINFKFGYSMMFASKSMEIIKNGNSDRFANWAWVMVTLKPVFFKQKDNNPPNN